MLFPKVITNTRLRIREGVPEQNFEKRYTETVHVMMRVELIALCHSVSLRVKIDILSPVLNSDHAGRSCSFAYAVGVQQEMARQ